ncbi:MAG TPA: TetR/AcrR family transcriptional regulator [Noviherbaspirillum sp.]|nr:TetR/AcrR family transcriptional regulator [Noviherbaspirillum sp.]
MTTSATPPLDSGLTRRGQQRREELIMAALHIIVREGTGAVSLRTVAKEAGASHGSVAYYFGTRDALMAAVLDYVFGQLAASFERIVPALEAAADSPERFAAVLVRYHMEQVVSHPEVGLAIQELNIAGIRDMALRPILHKWGKVHAALCRKAFLALGSTQPAVDYGFLLNAISGIVTGQFALPRRDFEKKIFTPAVERLVHGIAANGGHKHSVRC